MKARTAERTGAKRRAISWRLLGRRTMVVRQEFTELVFRDTRRFMLPLMQREAEHLAGRPVQRVGLIVYRAGDRSDVFYSSDPAMVIIEAMYQ